MKTNLYKKYINVLLVEDEQAVAFPIQQILSDQHMEVCWVNSGKKALELLKQESFDLMVLDVSLQDMSGFELQQHMLKEQFNSLPIIYMSGVHMDCKSMCSGYDFGGVDYLLKPVDPNVLIRKIQLACATSKQIQELEYIVNEKSSLEETLFDLAEQNLD